ncbi:FeoA family protein [Desulfobulbus propionicus]
MAGICLRHIPSNGCCTITAVRAEGEIGHRIRELGLIPGVRLSVVGRAPLRDPVAIRIRDYTLTLRNSEADSIFVEMIDPQPGEKDRD